MEKKEITEYELVLNSNDLSENEEKMFDYIMDLESLIKEKVEEVKGNQIDEITEQIKKSELPSEVLINNEFTISKHPVGVNGEEYIVDVRLVKVLSHHRIRVKMPMQVHKTDKEGNIKKDNKVS